MKLSNHRTWAQRERGWPLQKANLASPLCCLGPCRWGQHCNYISPVLIPCSTWLTTVWHPQGTLFGEGQKWGLLAYLPGVMQVPPLFHSAQQQGFPGTWVWAKLPKGFLLAPKLGFLQLLDSPPPPPHRCFSRTKLGRRRKTWKRNGCNPTPL